MMDAIWITLGMAVAMLGGWPLTAGILRLAKSKTVRAVDASESAAGGTAAGAAFGDAAGGTDEGTAEAVLPAGAPAAPTRPPAVGPHLDAEVLRGGLLIGFLERAAVAVAIFSGQPVAIAYVVAIKGLGRYPELKATPAASERFIIGTLASMLWSACVAVLVKVLLL